MLILGSYGFSHTQVRLKIGELIPDQTGNMLIVPLACMFEEETGQREKNCAAMLGFKTENIFVFLIFLFFFLVHNVLCSF